MEKVNKGENKVIKDPYRETLRKAIALLLMESGFKSATQVAIENLVETFASLLSSISLSTRNFMEYALRTQPTVDDVVLALANKGIDMDNLQEFAFRHREIFINLKPNEKNKPQQPLPKVVPFPPERTYKRSEAFFKPITEYENLRQIASENKRATETALAKYLAKTSKNTLSLFDDKTEDKNFLLIQGRENFSTPIYLSALMPSDQIFDYEELEYYYQLRNANVEELECYEKQENENGFIEYDVSPPRQNSDENLLDEAAAAICSTQSSSQSENQYVNPFLKLIKHQDN